MFLIVGGEGSSNRNASRDESVEAGDKSVEAGDESIEAGEKTPQSCYNDQYNMLWFITVTVVCKHTNSNIAEPWCCLKVWHSRIILGGCLYEILRFNHEYDCHSTQ